MTNEELLAHAKEAMKNAYSPYSGFSVGAALLCEDGSVYLGCNVENASFSVTCCAERVALFSAVSDRKRNFLAIAVAGSKKPCYPCGVCRQALAEFCDGDMPVICADKNGKWIVVELSELMPYPFLPEDVQK